MLASSFGVEPLVSDMFGDGLLQVLGRPLRAGVFLQEIQNPPCRVLPPSLHAIHGCCLLSMAGEQFKPVMPL